MPRKRKPPESALGVLIESIGALNEKDGFGTNSIRDIARRIGISPNTLQKRMRAGYLDDERILPKEMNEWMRYAGHIPRELLTRKPN